MRSVKVCVEAMIASSEKMREKGLSEGRDRQGVMNYTAAHIMEIATHVMTEILARVALSDRNPPGFIINAFGLINSKMAIGLSKVLDEYLDGDDDAPKENDTPTKPPLN